jgi:hypothetical protein
MLSELLVYILIATPILIFFEWSLSTERSPINWFRVFIVTLFGCILHVIIS